VQGQDHLAFDWGGVTNMATIIRTAEQAKELAEGLLDARRRQPWCVISTPNDSNQAVFDVDAIEDEVASVCEVYVV
jgi:hypothetical protein